MKKTALLFLLPVLLLGSCFAPDKQSDESDTDAEPTQSQAGEPLSEDSLMERGRRIAMEAQKNLLSEVSKAMQQGGPVHAIDFCHAEVDELMQTISGEQNARVARIARRYRNPDNRLKDERDSSIYAQWEDAVARGEKPQDVLQKAGDGEHYFYKPIMLGMETCLKCHGTPGKEINEATLEALDERYPDDRARNFELGELRGAWKIALRE